MKRLLSIVLAMTFVLAFGTASAGSLSNGITDFSGGSFDTFAIGPGVNDIAPAKSAQDVASVTVPNGVTDFSGGSHDLFTIASAPKDMKSVEGMAGGGLRLDPTPADLHNGITDFSGQSSDTGKIGL